MTYWLISAGFLAGAAIYLGVLAWAFRRAARKHHVLKD